MSGWASRLTRSHHVAPGRFLLPQNRSLDRERADVALGPTRDGELAQDSSDHGCELESVARPDCHEDALMARYLVNHEIAIGRESVETGLHVQHRPVCLRQGISCGVL